MLGAPGSLDRLFPFSYIQTIRTSFYHFIQEEQSGDSNLCPQRTQRPVHPTGAVVLPDWLARNTVLDRGSLGAEPDHHRHAVRAVDAQPRAAGADTAVAPRLYGSPGAGRPDRRVALPAQAAGLLP